MKRNNITIASIILALSTLSVKAQDVTKSTDERLAKVEAVVSKLPNISGFVNVRYQYSDKAGDIANGKDGFDIRRAYLDIKGNATSTVGYRLLVDFANSPKVLDAYAEWKPVKNLSVQAGQFKIPFSLENPYSPLTFEAIENSQVITKLVTDIGSNKNNGRDIGLQIAAGFLNKGKYNLVDVKAGVFNGNIINAPDNNSTKDVAASLSINPSQALSLNSSFYKGEFGAQNATVNRKRVGFGVKYDDQKLLLRSEYIKGTDNRTTKEGGYITAGYFINSAIQPIVKYDVYRDKSTSGTTTRQYIAGVNYYITKATRLQLNYTRVDNNNPATKNNNLIATQIFVAF